MFSVFWLLAVFSLGGLAGLCLAALMRMAGDVPRILLNGQELNSTLLP